MYDPVQVVLELGEQAPHEQGASRSDLCEVNLRDLPLARMVGGLNGSDWDNINLYKAGLAGAHLDGADLFEARFVSKTPSLASSEILPSTNLRSAYFDDTTILQRVSFGENVQNFVLLADVRWRGANLAALDWSHMKLLGDEKEARQRTHHGKVKQRNTRLFEYEIAERANRQLALALQAQGLNKAAAHFAYRAQSLQRKTLWFQMIQHRMKLRQRMGNLIAWLFSLFLFLIAGYGYKPSRSFLVISGFATA